MFRTTQQWIVRVVGGYTPVSGDNVAAARRQPKLIVDFSGIPLIDSIGLELLLNDQSRVWRMGSHAAAR